MLAAATTPSPPNGGSYSPASASAAVAMRMDGFRTMDDAETDAVSETLPFSCWDKTVLIFSMLMVVVDVFLDAWIAYGHLQHGALVYFALTLVFILVPSWIVTWISLKWCLIQTRRPEYDDYRQKTWLAVVLHVFQLAIVFRYLSSLTFGLKSQDKSRTKTDRRIYYQLMLWEDNDASVLRLVESFLESVPQLLLQVYVLTTAPEQPRSMVLVQVASIIVGVASVAWSLVAYIRTLRFSLEDAPNVSWLGTTVCYCWRLMVLVPRLVALTLFTSVFHWVLFIVCGMRWLLMYAWLIKFVRIGQYDSRTDKLCFKAVLAAVYIFCFIDLAPGHRRFRYAFFYAFTFGENALLLGLWYHYKQGSPWYETVALLGSFCSYCMGMVFLVIYYLLLHPNASSIVQPKMRDASTRSGYMSDEQDDSPEDTPGAGRRSPPRVKLADVAPNGDSSETSFYDSGDSPCSVPGFKVTAV
ncbi:XK-related protein 6-like [Amblyomma americanum]